MITSEFGESAICFGFWVLGILISLVLGMKNNDGQKSPRSGRGNGFIPNSFRAISSYLRIVSSGASTVARSAASVASSIAERDEDSSHDQVLWAGFDKLEIERGVLRRVLLLGYRSGFQVWDVEEADNVRDLVSRHDGPVSFMQMLPHPLLLKKDEDRFTDIRPLLVVCADSSGGNNFQDGFTTHSNEHIPNIQDLGNGGFLPNIVRFYSLRSQAYVHVLKFRSVIYSVRCSSRIVAISQASQIHCFDATTLERAYTIVTNPIVSGGVTAYGPLAVSARWLAYSGIPVSDSNSGRVLPKQFTTSASFSGFASNGSLVAHYAKESSKQLAAGIVTLGDMGYKKLSRYCSELLPDGSALQTGDSGWKGSGAANGHHIQDGDSVGMVIVRDIISKSVITQFRAHKSPISALCFDPSGLLLVTVSVQGHNINVFKIMPGNSGSPEAGKSYVHLYQLQRGLTNAVIRDISFSDDSHWIMISSSRGTSHLFAVSPQGGSVNFQSIPSTLDAQNIEFSGRNGNGTGHWSPIPETQFPYQESLCYDGPPVSLSPISRIRNGYSGWRGTVTGAAAAAAGRFNTISEAVASAFHNCKGGDVLTDKFYQKTKFHLLVFSPSGSLIQYALRMPTSLESGTAIGSIDSPYNSASDCDGKLMVEAIQKWSVCQKLNRREREDSLDIYGENGNLDSKKIYPEGMIKGNPILPGIQGTASRVRGNFDDKHHLYISEAELQMHRPQIPLWAKPGIYFQSTSAEDVKLEEENYSGELQIERIPTRMLEARSKDLVPVFDYLQLSKNQSPRVSNWSYNGSFQPLHQKPALVEQPNFPFGISHSMEWAMRNNITVADLPNGTEETAFDALMPDESKCFVNSNVSAHKEAQPDNTVNNRDNLKLESLLKAVNSNKESLKMENHFEDKDDNFD